MEAANRRQNIAGLHYLRAIATTLVVINHAIDTASFSKYFGPGPLTAFFDGGAGEIDFFFMMSGLIMISSATDSRTGDPRLSAGTFLKRRAQRIIPLLWFATICFNLALFAGYGKFDILSSLRTVTFWPVGNVAPFVAWTIRYEVMFYLVFSLCFLRYPRLWPLMFLWSAAAIIRLAAIDGISADDGSLLGFVFSPYYIEFGIGVGLGLLMRKVTGSIAVPFQLTVLILLALSLRVFVQHFELEMGSLAMILAIAPFCVVIMLITVYTTPARTSRLVMALGDASYSIFLMHPIVISPILLFLAKTLPNMSSTLAALVSVIASLIVGWVIHLWVERPLGRLDLSRIGMRGAIAK